MGLEKASIIWALRVIERSHVVILLIDPKLGVNNQDLSVANHILQHHKSGKDR